MTDEEIIHTIHDAAVALEHAMRAAEEADIRVEAEIRYPPTAGPDKGRRRRKVWIKCEKTLYSRGDLTGNVA